MKNVWQIFLIVLILFTGSFAQKKKFRELNNSAFAVGEKLTYAVKYGFVTAGIAEMEVPTKKRIAGRDVYKITFKVNTVSSFDLVYKVRDRYETYMDVKSLFPWRFEQHIREGGFTRDFSAFFDQRRGKAKTSEGTYEIPENVNDILSALYLARTFDYDTLKVGNRFNLQNFYKDTVYPLDVVYLGEETISVEAGTFKCIMVEPLVQEGGLFKSEGNIIVWLTKDNLHLPVKVKSKIIIGSIDAELTHYEGLAGNLSSLEE